MLEFQAYTWLSYLFYELKVMLCCVYTREKYFPLFSLLTQCEGVFRWYVVWRNGTMTYFDNLDFIDFTGIKVDQILKRLII